MPFAPKRILKVSSEDHLILKSESKEVSFVRVPELDIFHHRITKATFSEGWWCIVVESNKPPVQAASGRIIHFHDDEIYLIKATTDKGPRRNFSREVFGH